MPAGCYTIGSQKRLLLNLLPPETSSRRGKVYVPRRLGRVLRER
jgi:hypothetical protein